MPASYKNLFPDWGNEKSRMGGIAQTIYLIPVGDIETWASPAVNAAGEAKFVHSVPFVPKTDKGFLKAYVTPTTGELSMPAIGGRDGGGFDASVKIFIPGNDVYLNYIANVAQSDVFIALIPDNDGTTINQIGDASHFCHLKLGYKTDTEDAEHGKGYEGEITAKVPHKYLYTAAIPLKPAT
ncbi:hypothetical protein [Runella zeae]|uniref:hypothetical protein n=1 Tax=Runella zeae TaxID=94255 RepID=UPI0004007F67|nr:hypothetical protein [Runella zeae]